MSPLQFFLILLFFGVSAIPLEKERKSKSQILLKWGVCIMLLVLFLLLAP